MSWAAGRKILFLLAAATLIPVCALGWLGVRILAQDRDVERQRRRESLENSASRLALAIERRLGDIEEQLAHGSGMRLTVAGLEPDAGTVLLYLPQPPATAERSPVFSTAEVLEFRRQDLAGAAAAYVRLADSADVGTRAAALVFLGRVLRKQGDRAGALQVYDRLQKLGAVAVQEQPSELIARQARCRVFEESGDAVPLRREVSALSDSLYTKSWSIDRATFDFYRDLVEHWGGPSPEAEDVARTEAANALWRSWRASDLPPRGRRIFRDGTIPVLALWAGGPDRPVAKLVAPSELESWLERLSGSQRLAVSIYDGDGRIFTGSQHAGAVALNPSETRLPFTLNVASLDLADGNDYRMRRLTLVGGLLLLFTLMLAAAYGLYRATSRELDLARQQSDFVSAVSHEFRTPLTSMRHLTDLLVSRDISSEQRKAEYYRILANETERLHRMVESLLSFGRMEAGAYVWRLQSADVRELVIAIANEFRGDPQAAGRDLVCDIQDGLPPIHADREALSRALWNLLENAAKYSAPGTPIRVFARRKGESILLGVEDRGCGIPPDEQEKVFQRFTRGADAKRAGIRGVGMGLALVKRILEGHGGSVHLRSEPGEGSTFTLELPCHGS
ncbi:MAG TPA: HAMP domain-containing sensor histidine kinase [Bryobacteraceae bacterium]|nr:HAMP domain-containing sensor histidine kinase [Bryobacteraceae bacterium]